MTATGTGPPSTRVTGPATPDPHLAGPHHRIAPQPEDLLTSPFSEGTHTAQRVTPLEGEDLVAHNLKILRTAAQLSQQDVAERMTRLGFKFHQTQIAKIENGSRPVRFDEVVALAKTLDVAAGRFMTEAVEGPQERGYALRAARHRVQKAELAWRNARALEQAAKDQLEQARREHDEIAKRLAAHVTNAAPGPGNKPVPPRATLPREKHPRRPLTARTADRPPVWSP
ncbi:MULTISPECIES: helix-turn-helix domain-containing protein [unclassified Kitasatospora]|uniref:helix-turn-helix domain-containing protein n=1 Tax=unclassified Kitasatospora TaxID=2633591 RepID=UPI0007103FA6|nr:MULTISPECIES: helix-turn-helix transcriptional regulator [unclassified Kitasatospora]KQV20923.1 hypothetical protein ASC99_20685 [Kitasatospora sp. Root107]KRB60423.1 hypothetical protein ASE03_12495 [Kitasatospora sp. Root187]